MRVTLILMFGVLLNAQTPAPSGGKPQNGRKLFEDYGCYECHGHEGQGGAAGPRIAPKPILFAAFVKYVRQPANQMPPYTAKVVSDSELADIYAFLSSIPAPPAARDIPLLK
jgi:mono/diheme cytochrome c family protein